MTKRKQTHTLEELENLKVDYANKIQGSKTIEEAKDWRKKLTHIEKLVNDINHKKINGKKYPVNDKTRHADDIPMNKEEIMKLIDSVGDVPVDQWHNTETIDLSGVSVGANRFTFTEKG